MRSIELSYLSENRLVMAAASQFLRMTGFYVHETRFNSDKYICDYKYAN